MTTPICGFDIVDNNTTPPWGAQETANWIDLVKTVCIGSIGGVKNILGHQHNGIYSTDGLSSYSKEDVDGFKFGRAFSITVAPSTASAGVKARADYVCDGVSDQSEINSAIDTCYAMSDDVKGRGTVCLLSGEYYISSSILMKSGVSLLGQHGLYGVTLNGAVGIDVIKFIVTAANQGCFDIAYMTILGGARAINLTVDNVLGGYVPMDICIDRVMGMTQTVETFRLGEYINGVGTAPIWGLRMTRCLAEYCNDGAGNGDGFFICGCQCYIDKCFAANNLGHGFVIKGSSDILLQQCNSRASGKNGILFDCTRGVCSYNTIYAWNYPTDNSSPLSGDGRLAINAAGAASCQFIGNTIENHATVPTDLRNYGIQVPAGTQQNIFSGNNFIASSSHRLNACFYSSGSPANLLVYGNILNDNCRYLASGTLYTNAKIFGNLGLYARTERSGTCTITAGNTSVNVTHGSIVAPVRVFLTPTTDTNEKRFWISAVSSSTFTVSISAINGTDITFNWESQATDHI